MTPGDVHQAMLQLRDVGVLKIGLMHGDGTFDVTVPDPIPARIEPTRPMQPLPAPIALPSKRRIGFRKSGESDD